MTTKSKSLFKLGSLQLLICTMCCVQQNVAFILLPAYSAYFALTRLVILQLPERPIKTLQPPSLPIQRKEMRARV